MSSKAIIAKRVPVESKCLVHFGLECASVLDMFGDKTF